MKKLIITTICIFAFGLINTADANRYYTIQEGIPTLSGNIPTPVFTSYTSCDVFTMDVEGEKYFMVKGSAPYTYNNLVGCDGEYKTSMFSPLWEFDTNKDFKLSAQELKDANVRFVLYKNRQKLLVSSTSADFDTDKISGIDLNNTRVGITTLGYGNVDVYIKQE